MLQPSSHYCNTHPLCSNPSKIDHSNVDNACASSLLKFINHSKIDQRNVDNGWLCRLVGPLEPNISMLAQLTQLNLELNIFSGSIPSSLGELRNLNKLKLNGNRFSGAVPASIANLTNLVYLDLSNNRLNGSLPVGLGELTGLRYLDLSNNSFEGAIPFSSIFLSQLNTFEATGNPQLCYNATVLAGKVAAGLPPCTSNGLPNVAPDAAAPAAPPRRSRAPQCCFTSCACQQRSQLSRLGCWHWRRRRCVSYCGYCRCFAVLRPRQRLTTIDPV